MSKLVLSNTLRRRSFDRDRRVLEEYLTSRVLSSFCLNIQVYDCHLTCSSCGQRMSRCTTVNPLIAPVGPKKSDREDVLESAGGTRLQSLLCGHHYSKVSLGPTHRSAGRRTSHKLPPLSGDRHAEDWNLHEFAAMMKPVNIACLETLLLCQG